MSFCGRACTERACALSWYSKWDPEQKQAFTSRLVENNGSLGATTESLLQELETLSLGGEMPQRRRECPSVFECQLKIFDSWFRTWNDADKGKFLRELSEKDPDFRTKIISTQNQVLLAFLHE